MKKFNVEIMRNKLSSKDSVRTYFLYAKPQINSVKHLMCYSILNAHTNYENINAFSSFCSYFRCTRNC